MIWGECPCCGDRRPTRQPTGLDYGPPRIDQHGSYARADWIDLCPGSGLPPVPAPVPQPGWRVLVSTYDDLYVGPIRFGHYNDTRLEGEVQTVIRGWIWYGNPTWPAETPAEERCLANLRRHREAMRGARLYRVEHLTAEEIAHEHRLADAALRMDMEINKIKAEMIKAERSAVPEAP